MNLSKLNSLFVFVILILINGCLERYAPPAVTSDKNYLVVDGFLNAGDNSCTITLTQSQSLSATGAPVPVLDAVVTIEDSEGSSLALSSKGAGAYSSSNLALNTGLTYRLHIASNGKTYYSDYVPVNQSPAIDSVDWSLDPQPDSDPNVTIHVSTHGASDQLPYYLWNFQETWEYTAGYPFDLKFENGVVSNVRDTIYYCWQSSNSTSILTASSSRLSENVIHRFLLTANQLNSIKLKDGYSILVNQLSITQDAFEYFQQLKSNTENLGTVFGTQPTQLTGNIHSTTDPSEPVFGYFMASSVSSKRIFITPFDLPRSINPAITGYEDCRLDSLKLADVPKYVGNKVFVVSYGMILDGYLLTTYDCVDCRLHGGTNHKPSFWYY